MSIKTGIIWTSAEKLLTQLVQFVLGIIIARLITPEEYGVLGIIMVFVNVAQVFVDSGLGSALIYRNNLDKEDVQTTFSFNLIVDVFIQPAIVHIVFTNIMPIRTKIFF